MRHVLVAVYVAIVLGLTGCSGQKAIVGVVLPETGEASAYGTSIKTGVKLAFDEAVKARTAPAGLEVIYRDSGSAPPRALQETEALFKRGAMIVIGGATSPEAKNMISLAEKHERLIVSPSASEPGLAASSNLFFRTFPSDDVEGSRAAEFLVKEKNAKTVLVLLEDITYSHGLLPVFRSAYENLGGKIVARVIIGSDGWEKAFADALAKEKPEALYLCGYGEAILTAVVAVRDAKFEGVICTTSAIGTVDLVWRGGKLVDGLYFPMARLDLTSKQEPLASFVKAYRAANNDLAPDIYAACGYDAALLTMLILQKPIPEKVSDMLQRAMGQSTVRGVTGFLSFDSVGNIQQRLRIHQIRDGKVVDVDTAPVS